MTHLGKKDYFALFGLYPSYQQNIAQIKRNYHQLQQKIHPDNFVNATAQEKHLAVEYAALVNEAYQTLMDPLKRAIYLLKLHGIDVQSETDTHMPLDFLAEQMVLREEIEMLSPQRPQDEILKIKDVIENKLTECEEMFRVLFAQDPPQLLEARLWVRKMQFYLRLQQEIAQLQATVHEQKRMF